MFWDDLVRRWRREAGGLNPALLRAAAGNVAALPAPRRRRGSRLVFWLMALVLTIALLVMLGVVRLPA
jgi:type VI protein secretion system component VasF